MKTSFRKWRGFALHKNDGKEQRDLQPLAQLDELAQASQVMQDMRDCYDSLLSAAAATANSAYGFSESLREMGGCLLQKTVLNNDEESGKVLLMLGKVQFEVQKLVDSYRSHIFQTITIPSESLLNELRTVEEMKWQCDEKREVFEHMKTRLREKVRPKGGKGESFSLQQLQTACDEYDEEATLFIFRLKSLKQGQSRSLLTLAARHHFAQLCFFKKALMTLEGVEPHVKMVTERQHIDCQFGGLGDDNWEEEEEEDSYAGKSEGELSFDYGKNTLDQHVSTSQYSMELDETGLTFPNVAKKENIKENFYRLLRNSHSFKASVISQSAPLLAENKVDSAEKLRQLRPPFTKFHSYVLPTPIDSKGSGNHATHSKQIDLSEPTHNLRYSSSLEPKKGGKVIGDEKVSLPAATKVQSVLKESNINISLTQLPPPLSEGLMFSRHGQLAALDSKKIKRQAFSGPLTGKAGPILRNPIPQPPSLSPEASASFVSSPVISELHELPRPPVNSMSGSSRPLGLIGHSGPLVSRGPVPSLINMVSNAASPLPKPPQSMSRSFSIPSNSPRVMELHVSKPIEAYQNSQIAGGLVTSSL